MATINSIIVTASLSLNLYLVMLLKIYDQRRQLDILIKNAIISRNIAFEKIKPLKRRYAKVIQFFGSKIIHLRDDELGGESGNWLSKFISVSFFHRSFFSVLAFFKAKFFKKNPERCYLNVVPII